jgi:SSS family transporter
MHIIDWIVMTAVLLGIVGYGIYKTRKVANVKSYLLGDRDLPWWTIGLSVMATQASAITFLSTPGQAYEDGMRFAQFYFGLPVAMVFLCVFVLPIYYRLNVFTAYEYLEGRFDLKTRTLTALLFLIQRGLAAGITIYAPAIILSNIMGWNLNMTILVIGILVIFYTVSGGTKAVSITQKQQMIVILGGMVIAAFILVGDLPDNVGFNNAVDIAGSLGKLNIVDFKFDLSERYNFWSGMLGGVFLFLSYFGTDQSQVQRYLSGKSLTESRLGLLFNGIVKVPMQVFVLFTGILVFVFFQFTKPPIHYNNANLAIVAESQYALDLADLQKEYDDIFVAKKASVDNLVMAMESGNDAAIQTAKKEVEALQNQEFDLRDDVKTLVNKVDPDLKVADKDYVFITFITKHLPIGLIGLLLAVIFSAAMSSTSSELNALATTTIVDFYRRSFKQNGTDQHYFTASKLFTVMWGGLALIFAFSANFADNLIELVNIVGSVFYGAILGVFLVAFFYEELSNKARNMSGVVGAVIGACIVGYSFGDLNANAALLGGIPGFAVGWFLTHITFKKIGGNAIFIGALMGEVVVITVFILTKLEIVNISYLWLNLIGCVLVILFAYLIQQIIGQEEVSA